MRRKVPVKRYTLAKLRRWVERLGAAAGWGVYVTYDHTGSKGCGYASLRCDGVELLNDAWTDLAPSDITYRSERNLLNAWINKLLAQIDAAAEVAKAVRKERG